MPLPLRGKEERGLERVCVVFIPSVEPLPGIRGTAGHPDQTAGGADLSRRQQLPHAGFSIEMMPYFAAKELRQELAPFSRWEK